MKYYLIEILFSLVRKLGGKPIDMNYYEIKEMEYGNRIIRVIVDKPTFEILKKKYITLFNK